eukprot:CAMPEP_0185908980 /NCGR_PEP_ID=MMETSP0196C-20130402/10343_1 /TAXON_ID=2932 /ORGANISM="Alexandrium fundyense, Strain CCMP1719" /LENGTH=45 /DNA_ID= /DNA_START= /DNA_END= /DNA_ORIENTATION=
MPSDVVIKSYFQKYDENNSGFIGKTEFAELCYELGFHVSDPDTAF